MRDRQIRRANINSAALLGASIVFGILDAPDLMIATCLIVASVYAAAGMILEGTTP